MIVLSKKEAGPLPHAPTRPYPNPGRDPVCAFISSPTVTGPGAYVRTFGLLFSALRLVAGPRSSQQRKQRKNQDQDRINFQTSKQHADRKHDLGKARKHRKRAGRSAQAKPWPDIAKTRIDRSQRRRKIKIIQRDDQRRCRDNDHPRAKERHDLIDRFLIDDLAIHHDRLHLMRMPKLLNVQLDLFEHDHQARHLDAASCTARTRTDNHQEEQDHFRQGRP